MRLRLQRLEVSDYFSELMFTASQFLFALALYGKVPVMKSCFDGYC